MFRRKIYDKLLSWEKESDGKTALLIEGARRVGKSTLVEAFGKNEIDFLIARHNKICPIEVKPSGYKSHVSLDIFFKKFSSQIQMRYLIYTKDVRKEQDIHCIPVYMAPFL